MVTSLTPEIHNNSDFNHDSYNEQTDLIREMFIVLYLCIYIALLAMHTNQSASSARNPERRSSLERTKRGTWNNVGMVNFLKGNSICVGRGYARWGKSPVQTIV